MLAKHSACATPQELGKIIDRQSFTATKRHAVRGDDLDRPSRRRSCSQGRGNPDFPKHDCRDTLGRVPRLRQPSLKDGERDSAALGKLALTQTAAFATSGDSFAFFRFAVTAGAWLTLHARSLPLRRAKR